MRIKNRTTTATLLAIVFCCLSATSAVAATKPVPVPEPTPTPAPNSGSGVRPAEPRRQADRRRLPRQAPCQRTRRCAGQCARRRSASDLGSQRDSWAPLRLRRRPCQLRLTRLRLLWNDLLRASRSITAEESARLRPIHALGRAGRRAVDHCPHQSGPRLRRYRWPAA